MEIISNFGCCLALAILIAAVGNVAIEIIKAFNPQRKIDAYRIGMRWHIVINGAQKGDIAETLKAVEEVEETGEDA